MGALRKQLHLSEQNDLTLELSSKERHEYIDGQIYATAGAGENHNRICVNIGFHLRAANEWQIALLEEGEVLTVDCENYHATLTLD